MPNSPGVQMQKSANYNRQGKVMAWPGRQIPAAAPPEQRACVGLTVALAGSHISSPVEAVCLFNGTWLLRFEGAFSEELVMESQVLLDLYNNTHMISVI